ncbi:MAG: HNH endonuclease signature motif containing protein [Pseudonocardiaceae bacterium]
MIGYLDEDGTATVTGRRLPADQAAAACARIEDLAKAAKRSGHPGRVGALRATIYLGLLDGRWAQLTQDQIIADLLARATLEDTPEDADLPDPSDGSSAAGDAPTAEPAAADGDAAAAPSAAQEHAGSERLAEQVPGGQRVGVELRAELSTLLGQDRHPGEIPGWGPVSAETARILATAQRDAEWRYAITGPDGQLLLAGITRRRPTVADTAVHDTVRGGIVELHVPAALLTELAAHPETCGQWTAVVADLVAQYRTRHSHGTTKDGAPSRHAQDPAARFAGVVLRRHVQIRDRYCVHPGCRCPARRADIDHTVDHARGGATTGTNSGPLCGHDHNLKHGGGWRLHQPAPGHFTWTSPLGRIYHTRPQVVPTDQVDPLPGPAYPRYVPAATVDEDGPILSRPPPEPDPRHASGRITDPDEPPPF